MLCNTVKGRGSHLTRLPNPPKPSLCHTNSENVTCDSNGIQKAPSAPPVTHRPATTVAVAIIPAKSLALKRNLRESKDSPRVIGTSQHTPAAEGGLLRPRVALSKDGILVVGEGIMSVETRTFFPPVASQSFLNFSCSYHPGDQDRYRLRWGFWPIATYLDATIVNKGLLAVSAVPSTSIFSSNHGCLKVLQQHSSERHQTRRSTG